MSQMNDLFETILELCEKKYPEIPKDLITNVLILETTFCERPSEALKKIRQIIEDYVKRVI